MERQRKRDIRKSVKSSSLNRDSANVQSRDSNWEQELAFQDQPSPVLEITRENSDENKEYKTTRANQPGSKQTHVSPVTMARETLHKPM